MKKEIFKDIKIFDKKGGFRPEHTIGWKFGYKGTEYGNYISDQVPTGETYTYWDDDEEADCIGHVMKTVPLTEKDQIGLMKNMVEVMEKLIYPLQSIKVTPKMIKEAIEKLKRGKKNMSECKRELTYTCWNDCLQGGCPGHKATVDFRSSVNTYKFNLGDKKIYLEHSEMQAIVDLIKALNRCDTVKF